MTNTTETLFALVRTMDEMALRIRNATFAATEAAARDQRNGAMGCLLAAEAEFAAIGKTFEVIRYLHTRGGGFG